jgi:hypothetical protein
LSTMETMKLFSGKLFAHVLILFSKSPSVTIFRQMGHLKIFFVLQRVSESLDVSISLELSRFLSYIEISNRFSFYHTHTRKFKPSWLKWRRRVRIMKIRDLVHFDMLFPNMQRKIYLRDLVFEIFTIEFRTYFDKFLKYGFL